jgi:hypothetical protein
MRIMEWTSKGGQQYRLEIADGQEAVTTLQAGVSPLVTSTDDSNDFFEFVRHSSGSIGIVGSMEDLEGLITGVPADRAVNLYSKSAGVWTCAWRGFLQTTAFSQQWDRGPLQFAMPVVSPLGVLDSFFLKQESSTMNFAEFLVSMNKAKEGFQFWDEFVFPASSMPKTALLYRFQLQNYGTYIEKEARWQADSYRAILEDICKLFGWQCQERGARLVFLAADTDEEYFTFTAARLEQLASGAEVITGAERRATVDAVIYGNDHQIDFIDGKKSVQVSAETHPYNEREWSMNLEELEVASFDHNRYIKDHFFDVDMEYYTINYKNGYGITQNSSPGNFKFTSAFDGVDEYVNGANIIRERVINNILEESSTEWISGLVFRSHNIGRGKLLFKINTGFNIPRNYATETMGFAITGTVKYGDTPIMPWEAYNGMLGFKLYTGGELVTDLPLSVTDGQIGTYETGSLDLSGVMSVLPVKHMTDGEAVIHITSYETDDRFYIITELNIKLVRMWDDGFYTQFLDKTNKTEMKNDSSGWASEYSVSSHITTAKNHQAGYGVVLGRDVMAEPPVSVNTSGERPEKVLAERLNRYYKQSRKKLTAQVKAAGQMLNPMDIYRVGSGDGMACLAQTIYWSEDLCAASFFEIPKD